VIVIGGFEATVDFGDGLVSSKGQRDAFVLKLDDGSGGLLWSRTFGNTFGNEGGTLVAALPAGESLVVGTFEGSLDIAGQSLKSQGYDDVFVMRLTALGDPVWAKGFGSIEVSDLLFGAAVSSDGTVAIGGAYGKSINFGGGPLLSIGNEDMFVAKLRLEDGSHIWSRRFGGEPDTGLVTGLAYAGRGVFFATGSFKGEVDLGGGPLMSTGDGAIFLAKLRLP
jgi:hypothetical protein